MPASVSMKTSYRQLLKSNISRLLKGFTYLRKIQTGPVSKETIGAIKELKVGVDLLVVEMIRHDLKKGVTQLEVAARYQVPVSKVRHIRKTLESGAQKA